MGRGVKNPKRHIVSCRIDDDEMESLIELARSMGTNVTGILRHSLDLLEQDWDRERFPVQVEATGKIN